MPLLQDLFDISIPGQRINEARELRRQRREAAMSDARTAAAFDAIQSGDVAKAAAFNPELATRFAQAQGAGEAVGGARGERQFDLALKGAQIFKQAVSRGVDPQQAAAKLSRDFSRFEDPETVSSFFSALAEDPASADDYIAGLGPQGKPSQRYLNTSKGVFDTQTQQFIEGPGGGLDDDLLRARIDTERAKAARFNSQSSGGGKQSEGQKVLDREAAKRAVEFVNGGAQTLAANQARLNDALSQLTSGEDLSGGAFSSLPLAARKFLAPKSAAVQQQIQNAIQTSLKATLGAQFARIEGEQLLDRAFSAQLDEDENARRVGIVAEMTRSLGEAQQAQASYIFENGTIAGYEGPDFNSLVGELESTLRSFASNDGKKSGKKGAKTPAAESSGGLSADEQAELEALRKELGAAQ